MTDASPSADAGKTLWQWLPEFFRRELAPYPGRWSLVARMVIAATLSMLVIITFRIPYGAIGVNCAFILSRENLTSTAKSGFYFILAFAAWAALMPIGARMFASIPITHFLWEGVTAFLCFFLLRTLTNFPLATGVVVVATATMAIWYLPGPAELNVELTLWQILATTIGAVITFLVELVFRDFYPQDPIAEAIEERLGGIETLLRAYADGSTSAASIAALLAQYAVTGTGSLRQQITRNHTTALERARMQAIVSLVGRSVDIAAAISSYPLHLNPLQLACAKALAERTACLRTRDFVNLPAMKPPVDLPPLFVELERTLISLEAVLTTDNLHAAVLRGLDPPSEMNRLFVTDAFTNPDHIRYALAGTAASMLCYVVYVGLNWPGISTALTTCVLTALSNIGASRQKQMLRIVGASIGGFVLGLGSQIFVLPYIDSITGFTLLFACATGVSAYVATSSPRLSYMGLQMAFGFYLVNVTDFSISTDLTIGRDRAVGVLLGIGAMWLVFDHLYGRPAAVEMVSAFARSARLVAQLNRSLAGDSAECIEARTQILREQISSLFSSVNAEADAVPFESGKRRLAYLAARERIRRWLSTLRTVYVLELPLLHTYLKTTPEHPVAAGSDATTYLYADLAASLDRVAAAVESQLAEFVRQRIPRVSIARGPLEYGAEQPPKLAEDLTLERSHQQDFPLPLRSIEGLLERLLSELEHDVHTQPLFASQAVLATRLHATDLPLSNIE